MPRDGRPGHSHFLTALAVAAAIATIASTVLGIAELRSPFPFLDDWVSVADAEAFDRGTLSLGQLLRNHKDHCIAVPRLVMLLDSWLGAGQGLLAIAVTLALQALHALFLVTLAHRSCVAGNGIPATTISAVVVALFASAQLENFIDPFHVQFVLVYAAATAAFALLAAACHARRRAMWVAAA